jgi:hypothetical protein
MVALSYPTLIYQAWASGGGTAQGTVNALGTISGGVLASPSNSPTGASLADGFPIIEMTNPNAGGTGPNGGDVNGIFNYLTAFQAWVNAGGQFKFNATLAAAIGGYPVGTVLQLNTGLGSVVSTVTNNTQDPNSAMTGWAGWSGPSFNNATTFTATGTAPAYVLTPTAALSSLALGASYVVLFTSAGTTGSNTLSVSGTGAKSLMQYDQGGNLIPANIYSGLISQCLYNGTYWIVVDAVPASSVSSAQKCPVFNEGASATPVSVYGLGVLASLSATYGNNTVGAVPSSIFPSSNFVGTNVLPANFWVVGKSIKIEMWLTINCPIGVAAVFSLYYGGTQLPGTNCPDGYPGETTIMARLDCIITCTAVGAAGTATCNVSMWNTQDSSGAGLGVYSAISTVFYTNAPAVLDIRASCASGYDMITVYNGLMSVIA